MADCRTYLLDMIASCKECEWETGGKNAMGNAAQHTNRTGHETKGEIYRSFECKPE